MRYIVKIASILLTIYVFVKVIEVKKENDLLKEEVYQLERQLDICEEKTNLS